MYPNYKVKTSLGGPGHPHCCNMLGNMLQLIPGIPGNPERWQALPDILTFVHLCPQQNPRSVLKQEYTMYTTVHGLNQQYIAVHCSTTSQRTTHWDPLGSTGHWDPIGAFFDWSKALHQPRKLALQGTAFRWDMVRNGKNSGTRNALMTTNFGWSTILLHILRLHIQYSDLRKNEIHEAADLLLLCIKQPQRL